MGNKKELRKITQTEKAILNTRGEALLTMGIITIAISCLMAVLAIAMGGAKIALGFLAITFAYIGGAGLFSYKYQRTIGFLLIGIFGILLTITFGVLFCI